MNQGLLLLFPYTCALTGERSLRQENPKLILLQSFSEIQLIELRALSSVPDVAR